MPSGSSAIKVILLHPDPCVTRPIPPLDLEVGNLKQKPQDLKNEPIETLKQRRIDIVNSIHNFEARICV
jgi:hypothetical protein